MTVIGVRPREEYVAGHIPGALSVPRADLPKWMGEQGKRRDVVAYCRGPYRVRPGGQLQPRASTARVR